MDILRAWVKGLTVALFGALPCLAEGSEHDLVNLGRLSIARVYASGCNGGRPLENAFYGVRNAFDGGRNVVNDINYSTWASNGPEDFVVVRFSEAVTVTAVVIESGSVYDPPPETFWLQTRGREPSSLVTSPKVTVDDELMVYALPVATQGVREVTITFAGRGHFFVGEIRILGPAPAGLNLTEVTPPVDLDLMRQTAEDPDRIRERNQAFRRVLAEMELAAMRSHRDAIGSSADDAERARHWLQVNRGADRLAAFLSNDSAAAALIERASSLGVDLYSCEISGSWVAATKGYGEYLRLFPGGPDADEAWWMSRLRNGPRCGDFEGSREEYEELIRGYSDFLARFPKSLFIPEARTRLQQAREGLEAARR
jgi:hypothetical protein